MWCVCCVCMCDRPMPRQDDTYCQTSEASQCLLSRCAGIAAVFIEFRSNSKASLIFANSSFNLCMFCTAFHVLFGAFIVSAVQVVFYLKSMIFFIVIYL